MPVRYYRAPFQPQQPGGLGDVFNKAAQTMVWGAQTPDQLAELRARTGLLGEQTGELHRKNAQTDRSLAADQQIGGIVSGAGPGSDIGDVVRRVAGLSFGSGEGAGPASSAANLLTPYNGAPVADGSPDAMARAFASQGKGMAYKEGFTPGDNSGFAKQQQDADLNRADSVAGIQARQQGADTAANNAGAMSRTQAEITGRTAVDKNDQYEMGKRSELDRAERMAQAYVTGQLAQQRAETGADARRDVADTNADAKGTKAYALKPEDMPALSHTIETMAGGQGMLSDQELADTLQRAGEIYHQGGDAATAAGQAFHEKFGASPEISHGFLGFGKGISPDPNMHPAVAAALSSGTAPTSSPPAAPTTVPNPQAASGGAQAAASTSIPDPTQRVSGQVYQTPKGPMKWTGTGWLPAG